MEQVVFTFVDMLADYLDQIRSRILRFTMSFPAMRPLFQVRSVRLALLFVFSTVFSLSLSLLLPLWVLAVGPLIYGIPHLAASFRFFHYSLSSISKSNPKKAQSERGLSFQRTFRIVIPIWGIIALYRLLFATVIFPALATSNQSSMGILLSEWAGSNWVEILSLMILFFWGILSYKRSFRFVLNRCLWLFPGIYLSWNYPGATVGALILIHNFVGFFYWLAASHSKAEKAVAIGALTLTIFIHFGIFAGLFDAITSVYAQTGIESARVYYPDIGRMIVPWSNDEQLWFHSVVAYAFGQSLHYFIWLKAVPDQHHYHEVPTSFRQSVKLLQSDFGHRGTLWLISLILGGFLVWALKGFVFVRIVYFSLATFHGYLEIVGLALIPILTNSSRRTAFDIPPNSR